MEKTLQDLFHILALVEAFHGNQAEMKRCLLEYVSNGFDAAMKEHQDDVSGSYSIRH